MQALPTSRSVAVRFQLPRCQKTWKISGWMAGAEIGPIIGDQNLWFVPLFWNEHLENLPHTILEIWNKIAGAHKFGWGMYVYTYIYMYMYIYHINVIYLRKKNTCDLVKLLMRIDVPSSGHMPTASLGWWTVKYLVCLWLHSPPSHIISCNPTIVGWWFQPLWEILVSWDDYSQYMEK